MKLSPFSQYYIRQLLQQYFANLSRLVSRSLDKEEYFQIDLTPLLRKLYPETVEITQKIKEIEALVALHRSIAPGNESDRGTLLEVELRLYRLLGLRLPSAFITSPPVVLNQQQIAPFNFYYESAIRSGARYDEQMYGLVQRFAGGERLKAYQSAWVLKNYGVPAILTMSSWECEIWVNLRSPSYSLLLRHNRVLLEKFVSLHSTLFKYKEAFRNRSTPVSWGKRTTQNVVTSRV